jgi:ankyrin repeat/BTB/POZ domain-containing protein 1
MSALERQRFPSTYNASTQSVHEACCAGDVERVALLLREDPYQLDTQDAFNATPLYYASLCGHLEVVRYLLQQGANCDPTLFEGERAHYGCLTSSIRTLLESYQQAEQLGGGPLVLHLARQFDNPQSSDFLFLVTSCSPPLAVHTHRALLSCRSLYLAAKFSPGGPWGSRKEVVLSDPRLDAVALRAVLKSLYTDRFACLQSHLAGAARVARNLCLPTLQRSLQAALAQRYTAADGMVSFSLSSPWKPGGVPLAATAQGGGVREALWHGLRQHCGAQQPVVGADLLLETLEEGEQQQQQQQQQGLQHRAVQDQCHSFLLLGRSPFLRTLLHFQSTAAAAGAAASSLIALHETPSPVLSLLLDWLYADALLPGHHPSLLLATLDAAHLYIVKDYVPVLVSALISCLEHPAPTPAAAAAAATELLPAVWRMAETHQLQRLQQACVKYACQPHTLPLLLDAQEFSDLLRESSAGVKNKQEYDSVPILDALKAGLRERSDSQALRLVEERAAALGFLTRR